MCIVIVSNTAWSIFNFRFGLLQTLLQHKFQVYVLAPRDASSAKLQAMGCEVIDLPMSAKGINPVEDFYLFIRLALWYKKIKPRLIIHYTIKPNIYGSLAAQLIGIPSLAITTGLGFAYVSNNWLKKVVSRLYKIAFHYPKEVWFLNEDDRSVFLKNRLVEPSKAILLDSEGVNTSWFSPQLKQRTDTNIRFLLIARMLWDKGVGEFVDAACLVRQKYPNALFQLLGFCGVDNPSIISQKQINQWHQDGVIEYLGSTDDVRGVIAEADCVVLPSYREGVPRTLMEAAAMGKPIITTDSVGCREVVKPGITGLYCKVKDVPSLVTCCEKILTMSEAERKSMGQAGRQYMIDRFEEQKIIEKYLAAFARYGISIGS
jgi:glycosyltransferase involved in cell wall biosynthesis